MSISGHSLSTMGLVYGYIKLPIKKINTYLKQPFHLVPDEANYSEDGLLGNDFLHSFNCVLNYNTGYLEINLPNKPSITMNSKMEFIDNLGEQGQINPNQKSAVSRYANHEFNSGTKFGNTTTSVPDTEDIKVKNIDNNKKFNKMARNKTINTENTKVAENKPTTEENTQKKWQIIRPFMKKKKIKI